MNPLASRFILCVSVLMLSACGGGSNGTDGTNGTSGAAGASGSNGSNGSNGLTALVSVSVEPAGTHCGSGGSRINAGLDANGQCAYARWPKARQ